METTTLVGLARLWGQHEGIIFLPKNGEATPDTVMKGYDDLDLEKLLMEWAKEFDALPETLDLLEFFEQKVKELCEDFNLRQILKSKFTGNKTGTKRKKAPKGGCGRQAGRNAKKIIVYAPIFRKKN